MTPTTRAATPSQIATFTTAVAAPRIPCTPCPNRITRPGDRPVLHPGIQPSSHTICGFLGIRRQRPDDPRGRSGILPAMDRQSEYVLRTVEERGVRFVRLWFTDVLGTLKSFAITPAELETALEEGMTFDGSAIEGFARVRPKGLVTATVDWSGFERADVLVENFRPGVMERLGAGYDALTAIKVSNPAHGLVTLNSNGSFTYTPNTNWYGVDAFTYEVDDGYEGADTATVTITEPVEAPEVQVPPVRRTTSGMEPAPPPPASRR